MLKSTAIHYISCDEEGCTAQLGPVTATSGTNARRIINDEHGWVNSRGKDYCKTCTDKRNAGQLGKRIVGRK